MVVTLVTTGTTGTIIGTCPYTFTFVDVYWSTSIGTSLEVKLLTIGILDCK